MAGPYALFLVFSVCIGLIQVGMAPRCGALLRRNGTAVPDGITFRPFSTNFDGYRFGGAVGRALHIDNTYRSPMDRPGPFVNIVVTGQHENAPSEICSLKMCSTTGPSTTNVAWRA
jgi:hypothetical protein